MRILGIGVINAFALVSVIGDIKRFDTSRKLCSYLGVNPSQKTSGVGKRIKIGSGKRGRKDARSLLIQAAQNILLKPKKTGLKEWAMKLLFRKGNRNIAVMAIARKLVVYVWHALNGRSLHEEEKQLVTRTKLVGLITGLGEEQRKALGYASIVQMTESLAKRILSITPDTPNSQIEALSR